MPDLILWEARTTSSKRTQSKEGAMLLLLLLVVVVVAVLLLHALLHALLPHVVSAASRADCVATRESRRSIPSMLFLLKFGQERVGAHSIASE